MLKTEERAAEYFSSGYNCSQAVITAHADSIGLHPGKCKSIASPFGGGVSGRQRICGAVTGALMVIGMWYYDDKDRDESKQRVKEKSLLFLEKFEQNNDTVECAELLGMDMDSARNAGLFESKCPGYVKNACRILDELLPGI